MHAPWVPVWPLCESTDTEAKEYEKKNRPPDVHDNLLSWMDERKTLRGVGARPSNTSWQSAYRRFFADCKMIHKKTSCTFRVKQHKIYFSRPGQLRTAALA